MVYIDYVKIIFLNIGLNKYNIKVDVTIYFLFLFFLNVSTR